MKNTRKLFCTILAVALLILSLMPAYAAVSVKADSNKIYLDSTGGSYGWGYININGINANSKITDIKSSNTKILRPSSLNKWSSSYKDFENDENSSADNNASISVRGLKKGKADITFKVDGKSYKQSFEVLNYVNPVKSFQLTGVGSTNLKSKFAKGSYVDAKLKSNSKAGYVKVSAASGWKIRSVEWSDQSDNYSSHYFYSEKGVSSAKVIAPAMKKSGKYSIWVNCINAKNGARLNLTYHLGN